MATMLSEVARQPHAGQPPPFINASHGTSREALLPQSSHHRFCSIRDTPIKNASFRQRLERPQQCAQQLRGRLSPRRQLLSVTHPGHNTTPLEHMLRCKTPNGTLAAGYDGSPVEWNTRPHASKHLLIHASNPLTKVSYDTLCMRSQAEAQPNHTHHGPILRAGIHQNAGPIDSLNSDLGGGPNYMSAAGFDSVLNQSSLHNQHYRLAGDHQVPIALQPMWPPCLGPTTVQNAGHFGPYWPDGAYEPYRPAACRDPRYLSCDVERTGDLPSQFSLIDFNYQNLQDYDDAQKAGLKQISTETHCSGRSTGTTPPPKAFPGSIAGHVVAYDGHRNCFNQRYGAPLVYRSKEHPWKDLHRSPNLDRAYRNLRVSNHEPSRDDQGRASKDVRGHAQFKERVLLWAHRIYGNLLACIEQARRNAPNEQPTGHQHSGYYPQPPRRPYPSWSNGHLCDASSATNSTPLHKSPNGLDFPQHLPNSVQAPSLRNDVASVFRATNDLPVFVSAKETRMGRARADTIACQASYIPSHFAQKQYPNTPPAAAIHAIEILSRLCEESNWLWTDGMLLNGCLAYGLADYDTALKWYLKVLQCDPNNVEAMSNLAATLILFDRRQEAEQYWARSVKLRPSYFEAVEHLVGLLHESHRGREAVKIVEYVEQALRFKPVTASPNLLNDSHDHRPMLSGYSIPPSDNGRLLALIHGKGNVLYQIGDNSGAARAFEDAILIGVGRPDMGIQSLIKSILNAFSEDSQIRSTDPRASFGTNEPILLTPEMALKTSHVVFAPHGRLPGLEEVPLGMSQKAAVSVVSNSLLSLAKIYQDGMSSSGASATAPRATSGVQEILALYYLSLSLQPSPSTANNVGILLAGVQQSKASANLPQTSSVPGVVPGSGVALALAYYDYGLKLDAKHAHLYTNLGSLFKDIGQLNAAIRMYEKAVECDGNFDIALANLANAVKDKGEIGEAINYYRRAVTSNPEFAEAVCGLANALNSVCKWDGRGGIRQNRGGQDRWHVDQGGVLYDSKKSSATGCGWIERVVSIVEKQLLDGQNWGKHILQSVGIENLMFQLSQTFEHYEDQDQTSFVIRKALANWSEEDWEGAKVVRLIERATRRLGWLIYRNKYIQRQPVRSSLRQRPQLPAALAIPGAPTVLPFHTFTCPLSAKQIRKISQRNGLRVSCTTLRAPWLPHQIFEPPPPPNPHLYVGYISSDFNNHPLAHLMQSVFGFHDRHRVKAICYATTAGDGSLHRRKIESEAPIFHDASTWSIERLVNQVVADGVHILVNLNGYTRGAKNEVFAARPAPIQMSFMGFAGTLGAEWCDYLLADQIAVPPQTLRPWRRNVDLLDQTQDCNNEGDQQDDWIYGENIIYTKDTFFCCDHRQSAPDAQDTQLSWPEEQERRWRMRKELFPELGDDTIILGNFNQLYKV